MATLSTPVGATSLGNYIFSGLQTRNDAAVLVGCAAAALLALVLDGLIRLLEAGSRAPAPARGCRPRWASSRCGRARRAASPRRAAARGATRGRDRRQDVHRAVRPGRDPGRQIRRDDRARDARSCRRSARRSPSTRWSAARSTSTSTTRARIWATLMHRSGAAARDRAAAARGGRAAASARRTAIARRGRARLREHLRARDARASTRRRARRAHASATSRRTRRDARDRRRLRVLRARGVARARERLRPRLRRAARDGPVAHVRRPLRRREVDVISAYLDRRPDRGATTSSCSRTTAARSRPTTRSCWRARASRASAPSVLAALRELAGTIDAGRDAPHEPRRRRRGSLPGTRPWRSWSGTRPRGREPPRIDSARCRACGASWPRSSSACSRILRRRPTPSWSRRRG